MDAIERDYLWVESRCSLWGNNIWTAVKNQIKRWLSSNVLGVRVMAYVLVAFLGNVGVGFVVAGVGGSYKLCQYVGVMLTCPKNAYGCIVDVTDNFMVTLVGLLMVGCIGVCVGFVLVAFGIGVVFGGVCVLVCMQKLNIVGCTLEWMKFCGRVWGSIDVRGTGDWISEGQ